jgi:mRNA-degrading endonuclease RelE of RelBE toxin-antitoxin system
LPTSPGKRLIQRTNRFGRDVRRLSQNVQKKAFQKASLLSADIFDSSLNIKSLTGFRGIYRVVVVRDCRMIFSFDDENIYLLRIEHRREIYRNLEI